MARTSLGSKALSVLLAVGLVASLNAPVSAWAAGDDATGAAAVEQSLDPAGGGESENADAGTAVSDAPQAVENQSDEAEAGTVTVNDSDALKAAIAAANDGDTITLGEGEFTTYGNTSPKKSLTFAGSGPNTVWSIGNLNGTANGEGNGDYSFDGCDTITFKNMTLKSDAADYRGFIRINNTVVENCTLVGKTAYWGFNTAKFSDSTFNAPEGDYALWDYSTKEMSFDNCTFNISGKGVNVYVEAGNAGEATRTVAVNNCTVNSTKANKAFLNIKNSTCAYDVMLSGTNTVNGLEANSTTGSALYQVETTEVTETSGKTVSVKQKAADGTVTTLYEVKQASSSVAKVGDTEYATLAEAIAGAKDGETVTLLSDAAEDVAINKSITLDLGGKTLTNTNAGKATISVQDGTVTVKNGNVVGGTGYYNIEVTKGSNANLTLTDVTATAGNNGSSMIDNWGTLTITSGTYTGGLDVVKSEEGSKLTINGGTFTLDYATNGYTAVILVYGDTTISGGEFIQSLTTTGQWNHPQVVATGVVEGYTAITRVTGGHFVNKMSGEGIFRGIGKGTSDNFEVSGGTFNKSISDSYCADGFIPAKNSDGTYGVKECHYVAQVGSKKYETLADAIRLAAKGKTVTLLADVEQNTQLTIDKSITLDLNGKTIKNTVNIWGDNANAILSIKNGAKVTIAGNGTIDAKENDCYAINVAEGDLTIENGTFYGNVSVVQVQKGILSVKGGTFDLHQKWKGGSQYLLNCIDDAYADGSASVAISGGTFVDFDPNVSPEKKVDGKAPSFAAPGVGITKNEDGSFTAAASMTAQILDKDGSSVKAYDTLAEAVAAAEDGQTVRLLSDVTLDSQVATGKAITIDGQSRYTIKAAEKLVGADGKAGMFYRTQSAKGTLTFLNVTLNGGGVSKIFLNEGGAGETVFDGVTSTNGGGIAYGSGIHISGGGSHATIRNSTLTGSTGTMELNDTNYYAANDLWVGGNVYVTVENSVIGNVFVNSAPSATATNGVVHGQLTITGENTKITYLSGEEESTDKLDKFGNNGSLVKIDFGYVETIFDKGSYEISGGTFKTEIKEEWCAAGYIPTTNSDDTYSVKEGTYVAEVDKVKYDSLQAAINAAKGGSTVRLLADVTLTETAVFPAGKTVHINLMGHNITATGTALRINGTTDIQDTSKTGIIESTGRVAVEVGDNAKVTVYSGTLKGREGAVVTGTSTGATIEIKYKATLIATDNAVIAGNGSNREGKPNTIIVKGSTLIGGIESEGYIACGIYAPWNDNITVSGGTFNITNGAGIVARAGTVKVTGGTFNCTGDGTGWVGDNKNQIPCAALVFDKAANYPALTNDSQILVSGGTFSTDPAANGATLANGYGATKNDDGMYKVAKLQPVAAIGDVKYDTLGQAITAAQDTAGGATITLLKSIETSSYYEVKGDNPVTIDLNGFNITGSGISGLFYVTASGDLTITGEGAVTAVEDNGAAMAVWVRSPKAKVTLAGGTYKQQISNTEDTHFDLIYVERGTAEITGGKYEAFTPEWTLNCKDEHYKSGEAKITVTGGTFNSFDPANNTAEGAGTSFVPTDYISTDNGDGTYSVEEGKFTVQVTSRTTTSDSPVANVSGGGSDITYAEGTTVTASAISGYKFVGWFVNEYAGTPYSTDLTCTVKPTDNCTMIAVYEPVSGGKFWLTVTASEFTVNGGAVQDSYLYEQYAIGASVTVNFTGSENFLYWVNASNKVVSTNKSYTFTMGSETTLKAVYGKARQNQATVVFISHSDQIISSKAYTASDTIQFPVPPIKMGCTFTGWSMTEDQIHAAMANNDGIIQVRALYTEPSVDCKVTVVYPDGTGNEVVNAKVGQLVNVTAKDIEGKTFSYWTDNDGNVLGYTKTLKLAPSGDMTVNAIYSDGATEAKPVISMTAVDANAGNGYYLISFTATRAVPEGYELVKQGVLYSIDSRCAGDAGKDYLKLTADGTVPEGVYEYSGGNNDPNGVTRFNGKVRTADTTLYGRGYMILKNSAGEVLYVYSDTILSGSYNSLKK